MASQDAIREKALKNAMREKAIKDALREIENNPRIGQECCALLTTCDDVTLNGIDKNTGSPLDTKSQPVNHFNEKHFQEKKAAQERDEHEKRMKEKGAHISKRSAYCRPHDDTRQEQEQQEQVQPKANKGKVNILKRLFGF